MTELIHQFPGKRFEEWEEWYRALKPDTIETATERVLEMLNKMKGAMHRIDRSLVEAWIRDLLIVKTFVGLKFGEAVLIHVAKLKNTTYRLATPEEEAKGIDGFIGNTPVSIKPITYRTKKLLPEDISVVVIYYTKTKKGLTLEWDDAAFAE